MPLLSRFLDGSPASPGQDPKLLPRLIDYELLCGPDGKRTVGFGWFAGGKYRCHLVVLEWALILMFSRWCHRVAFCHGARPSRDRSIQPLSCERL
jgi:hypothetical protein